MTSTLRPDEQTNEEVRRDMRVLWDVEVPVRDGTILRADVFLPLTAEPVPAILSLGCYAKGIRFQEGYTGQWDVMVADFPEIAAATSNDFQVWEVSDPERFVPHGYAMVRVDSRGAGRSPGVQELWSQQEAEDYYDAIQWAADQPWCDGQVGLLGISYYAANQWQVAALQPPALKAIVPWEGTSDHYRELFYHGGIRSTFLDSWSVRQRPMQYGYGSRGLVNPMTGVPVAGSEDLTDAELAANRVDVVERVREHPLRDEYHAKRAVDWAKVTIPVLSSANWGGQGLHLRGNVEGFLSANTDDRWLEIHGHEHWTQYYTDYGVDLQLRFLDHVLRGVDNGWDDQPRVLLQVRHLDHFEQRAEQEWPLARTEWTRLNLDAGSLSLGTEPVTETASASYEPTGDGLSFVTAPFETETEVTGPLSATLNVSSATTDADLFLVLRLLDPAGDEVVFRGAMDAHAPLTQGWLRASHRALDEEASRPYRPVHPHDTAAPLEPGDVHQLEVEIWPTSIVIPAGYRLALDVQGRDYEFTGTMDPERLGFHRYPSKGTGPFRHPFGPDRPEDVYAGTVTVHTGPAHPSSLLIPVIPNQTPQA